jgi:hypothetical protein
MLWQSKKKLGAKNVPPSEQATDITLVAGDDIATTVQFRFFIGVTFAFAVGGGIFLKDPKYNLFAQNHNYYIFLFAIPGTLFALPLFLFSAESTLLPVFGITWGTVGGGGAYLLSTMLSRRNK